jgi:phosphoglycolate phosphatase-like HAD superfamily hydrolase
MSYQFELALRQYIAAFDGTNDISQAEFQSRFDNLYHKDFTFLPMNERVREDNGMMHLNARAPLTREEVFEREASKLANGTKVTLIHLRKIGLDCFDIKLGVVSGKEENTVRVVTTISAKQAVVSREIDESFPLKVIGASCASVVYKWKEIGTFQTNM